MNHDQSNLGGMNGRGEKWMVGEVRGKKIEEVNEQGARKRVEGVCTRGQWNRSAPALEGNLLEYLQLNEGTQRSGLLSPRLHRPPPP